MNEITADNFEEQFPTIVKNIRDSVFLAVDCEFSGLVSESRFKPTYFDSPADRYFKQRNTVGKCSILQFGLATFAKDPIENKFQVNYYTFYTCRRNVSDGVGPRFVLDTSALEFLAEYEFDFNKWMNKGITYMNNHEATDFKRWIEDDDFLEEVVLDGGSREDHYTELTSQINTYSKSFHDEEDFGGNQILIPFKGTRNSMKNYAIIHNLRKLYPMFSIKQLNGHIIVRKPESDEEIQMLRSSYESEELEVIDYMIGLSRVFQAMVEAEKPLIGHNVFLDLLYMYESFHDPLPKSLDIFKKDLMKLFPFVYDTKHIFVNVKKGLPIVNGLKSGSNLFKLYEAFNSNEYLDQFRSTPPIEVSSHENLVVEPVQFQHDAGFDAFMAGYVFIRMVHGMIASSRNNQLARPSWQEYQMMVESYANQANLICAQTHSVNLAGKDGPSKRPPWIYVRAKEGQFLDHENLKRQLSYYGRCDIEPISFNEAMIATGNFNSVSDILEKFSNENDFVVQVYNKWKHNKFFRTMRLTGYVGTVALSAVLFLKLHQVILNGNK